MLGKKFQLYNKNSYLPGVVIEEMGYRVFSSLRILLSNARFGTGTSYVPAQSLFLG